MVEELGDKIQTRINVLQSVYDVSNGRANHQFRKSALFEEALKKYQIKKPITQSTLDYLSGKNLIVFFNTDNMHITSDGIDEVERKFPILRNRNDEENSLEHILSELSKGNKDIITQIEDIRKWESFFNELDIKIIEMKSKIDKIYSEVDSQDLKNQLNELLSTSNKAKFIMMSGRILSNPEFKQELKKWFVLDETSSVPLINIGPKIQ